MQTTETQNNILALCNNDSNPACFTALCQIILAEDGSLPEWIEMVPAGKMVALDGRKFDNAKPEDIVSRFNERPTDIPIDFEHSTEIKAPKGEHSPATGWVDMLQVRAGAIWGHIKEWTPRGVTALTNKEYRYFSPAFKHTKTGLVLDIVSGGLTNKPALGELAAVAHVNPNNLGEENMDPEFLASLGLAATATKAEAMAAIRALQSDGQKMAERNLGLSDELKTTNEELATARSSTPSIDKFVPRSDHDAVVAKCAAAEKQISDKEEEAKTKEINDAVEAASKAGKITPESVEYHKSSCSVEGGLERFQAFVKTAPVIGKPSGLDGKDPNPTDNLKTATASQLEIAQNCGVDEEQLKASL